MEDEVNFYSEPQYYEYGSPEQDVWTGGETQTPDYGQEILREVSRDQELENQVCREVTEPFHRTRWK